MTRIKITNNESFDVFTYITLGATSGCIQEVDDLIFSDELVKIRRVSPLMCFFIHKSGESTYISTSNNLGLNGNVSFDTPPMNCSGTTLPYGMNVAEFIINNSFQDGNPQETIDNSCVAGANAEIKFLLDTDDWSTNNGETLVTEFKNNIWNNNTGIVGVFPYGCDTCTGSIEPPSCVGLQLQNVNKLPICNVQRNAKGNKGGIVEIILLKLYQ